MGRTLGLHDLIREVVAAIQPVDEHVLGSNYIRYDYLDRVMGIKGYICDYSDPEAHLENFEVIHYWEKYFEFVLQEWNLDVDGERMSESQFNFIIDRLTTSASQLDHYGPQLVSMYQDIPNVPEKRIQGIIRRRAVLNGFLNSAEIGLEHYYRSEDFLKNRTLRQRRPMPEASQTEPIRNENSIRSPEPQQEAQETTSRTVLAKLLRIFSSNSTLIALTTLVTIASALVQAYGYSIATKTSTESSWNSAEFFNTMQSALMQLLSLYVTVLPSIRHRSVQSSYKRWSWVLAGLGIIPPFLAIGYFHRNSALSQLVLFLGSAIQSVIILQLVWAVDFIADMERKQD